MTRKRSIYTIASVYIGTVIGGGFASGQEIIQFFGIYGGFGILGLVFSTFVLGTIAVKSLQNIYRYRINSFEEFGKIYFGEDFFYYINLILAFLLLIGYFIMLAGSGAIAEEHFSIPKIYGIIFMSAINFIIFISGTRGIAKANKVIVPLLIGAIGLITVYTIKNNGLLFSNFNPKAFLDLKPMALAKKIPFPIEIGWIWSAMVYAAHNSIGAIVVMTSLLPFIYDEGAAILGGLLGALGLGVMGLLILLSLLILQTNIIGLEVPMLSIAYSLGSRVKYTYSLVLFLAMLTTAIANGYGAILRFSYIMKLRQGWALILVTLIAIPLASLGFGNLVKFFYPLIGYMGFLFIGMILCKTDKGKRKGQANKNRL